MLVIGSAQDDELLGGANDDVLIGGAGSDTIDGGEGSDTFIAGAGSDEIDGGEGADTLSLSALNSGATIDLSDESLSVGSDATPSSMLRMLLAIDFVDDITGDSKANVIDGGDAGDTISAGDGDDVVIGGDGSDTLSGGAGDDIIYGDALSTATGAAGSQSGLALSQSYDFSGITELDLGDITILTDKYYRGFEAVAALPTTAMVPDDSGYGEQCVSQQPECGSRWHRY